jgi:hypothetical protein
LNLHQYHEADASITLAWSVHKASTAWVNAFLAGAFDPVWLKQQLEWLERNREAL